MKKLQQKQSTRRQRGQGLVEFAISLPLLLIVLAGVLEVANLILLYSRVDLAARESARFGAVGGTDIGVREVFEQNAGEGLEMDPGLIEVWIVRPVLEKDGSTFRWQGGSGWGSADEVCIYPEGACDNPNSGINPDEMLNRIANSTAEHDSAVGDRFVIVGIYYEAKTILNLPFFQIGGDTGRVPLRTEAIFRQEIAQQTVNRLAGGCSAYPIALNTTTIAGLVGAREGTKFTVDESNRGPLATDKWDYLAWNAGQITHQSSLNTALDYPGGDYVNFQNAGRAGDTTLHRGDLVWWQPASPSDSVMAAHVTSKRTLRVILYHPEGLNYDPHYAYQIDAFAIIRAISYTSGQFTFEFIRTDQSCGESQS